MAKIPSYSSYQNSEFYNENLSQTLTSALSDNGWTLPPQSTESIETVSTSMPDGTMWYDSSAKKLTALEDGVLVRVNTTPI